MSQYPEHDDLLREPQPTEREPQPTQDVARAKAKPARGAGASGRQNAARLELLRGGRRPRDVLVRISDGDPLGLRTLGRLSTRARAVFCDGDRLHLRSLAVCARRAILMPPKSAASLGAWLEAAVDEALTDLLDEEAERLAVAEESRLGAAGCVQEKPRGLNGAATTGAGTDVFALLGLPLGLDPAHLRRTCARFNGLDDEVRRTFQRFLIDGESIEREIESRGVAAHESARRARTGLQVFLADPRDSGGGEPRRR